MHRWFIRWLSVLVPKRLRRDWRDEWESELAYREQQLAAWTPAHGTTSARLMSESLGAAKDVLWLQTRRWEDEVIQDIRYGVRLIRRSPWLAAAAIASLAIGIGATTALFSVINAALLKPLPYPEADRLMFVTDDGSRYLTVPAFLQLESTSRSLVHLSAVETVNVVVTGDGIPEQIKGQLVTGAFAALVGLDGPLGPVAGRMFTAADGDAADAVAVISYRFWQRRYGGSRSAIGRSIVLDARPVTIIGVLPDRFDLFPESDVLRPLTFAPAKRNDRLYHSVEVYGRLRAGTSSAAAGRELAAMRADGDFKVSPLRDDLVRDFRRTLLTMWGMAALVLLIGCMNFANLLLARASARGHELAVRAALGGRRLRLARQLVVEALLLVGLGGAGGLAIAHWGGRILTAATSQRFLGASGVALDLRVTTFAVLVSLMTGVVFALVPALKASLRAQNDQMISAQAVRTGAGAATGRRRGVSMTLASLQVALTLVLLVGAGLLVKSFWRLDRIEPGYAARDAVTFQVDLPGTAYGDGASVARFIDAVVSASHRLPGVERVASASNLPLSYEGMSFRGFAIENGPAVMPKAEELPPPGLPPPPPPPGPPGAAKPVYTFFQAVCVRTSPGLFDAMGIAIRSGRDFDAHDTATSQPVAIVNQAFADRYWPGIDAVGKRIRIRLDAPWITVVGVAGNIRRFARDDSFRSEFYLPFTQSDDLRRRDRDDVKTGATQFVTSTMFVVRTGANADVVDGLRHAVASIDASLPLARVSTLQGAIDDAVAPQRLLLRLFVLFGTAALLLAAVGVYGVTTYVTLRQRREIAVRVALGATPQSIERLVMAQGVRIVAAGLAAGLTITMTLSRVVQEYLFQVSPYDRWAYGGVAALLGTVVLAACYLPARRAGRIDPVSALKNE